MMKNNENKNYDIQELFDNNIEVPETLSKWNVMSEIHQKQPKQKKVSSISYKKLLPLAACLVIAIVAAFSFEQINDITTATTAQAADYQITDTTAVTQEAMQTTSDYVKTQNLTESVPEAEQDILSLAGYETITDHFKKLYDNNAFQSYYCYNGTVDEAYTIAGNSAANYAQATTAAAVTAAPSVDSSTGTAVKDYSQTNTQYENIDEGDIVKNDSRYIYIVAGYYESNILKIIDTQTMQVVFSDTVKCKDGSDATINQIFVNGDILVAVCSKYTDYYSYKSNTVTFSVIYDITDRADPKIKNTVSQDGGFSNARMIGSVLYTLSTYTVYGTNEEEVIRNSVPMVNGFYVGCKQIYIEDEETTTYVVLTAYDTLKNDEPKSICILGGGSGVYCSEKNFYAFDKYSYNKTKIIAFSIDGTNISLKAKGEVPGYTGNQYYFDEYNGFLRVATTKYNGDKDADESNLYILDSDLKQVSSLENIAYDERVESARFMGDKAYLVTYEQTDPLFTLDLSDPYNPKIMGELKLPGFSYYLHPVDENTVLGFGYHGTLLGANYNTVKVSLFDISDFNNPKEIDKVVINNASTELAYNTKVLIFNPETNIYSIPVCNYSDEYWAFVSFKIADGTIEKTNEYEHDKGQNYHLLFRGIYISDKFFTICDKYVIEYNLNTGEKLRECQYYTQEDNEMIETYGATTISSIIE